MEVKLEFSSFLFYLFLSFVAPLRNTASVAPSFWILSLDKGHQVWGWKCLMQWDSERKTTHIAYKGIYLFLKINICTGCLEVHKRVQIRIVWYPDTNIPHLINTDNFFTAFTEYKWSVYNISAKQILFFVFFFKLDIHWRLRFMLKGNIFTCMLHKSGMESQGGALVPFVKIYMLPLLNHCTLYTSWRLACGV